MEKKHKRAAHGEAADADAATITFKSKLPGVNAEKRKRVELKAHHAYEVLSKVETRPGSFKVAIASPDETHPGGSDGKTELPCTILVQVSGDEIV